jgi:MtN3 and saliva related transmembrane protein
VLKVPTAIGLSMRAVAAMRFAIPEPAGGGKRLRRMDFPTMVGLVAAFCTTISYWPQLKKCWQTRSAGDLSFTTFATLAVGIATWIVYGFLRSDVVIMLANAVSLCLLSGILYFKLTETAKPARSANKDSVRG